MTPASLEVAQFDDVDWTVLGEHREYNFRVKHLLKGQDGARDNFRLTFSETATGGPQSGPKHRHTFDQFRMPLRGRTKASGRIAGSRRTISAISPKASITARPRR